MASIADISKDKAFQQILAEWKRLYAVALIDLLQPGGAVLQVGFGDGTASDRILSFKPKSLHIIESNAESIQKMKNWAKSRPEVVTIEQGWEQELGKLGVFDSIFFNDDIHSDLEILGILFPEEMQKTSNQSKEILNNLKEQITGVKLTFSEKDIEDFYQKIGRFKMDELYDLFLLLKENGNISEELYQKSVQKYRINKVEKSKQDPHVKVNPKDAMLSFLEACLKDHMHKGSKFTAFLRNQVSKYADSAFYDSIILNPNLAYSEETMTLNMTDRSRTALAMILEKIA